MKDLSAQLPGRLGESGSQLQTDPRADPRIVAAMEAVGGFEEAIPPLAADATYQQCLDYCAASEEISAQGNEVLLANLPVFDSVSRSTETIAGSDGNAIELFIHRPNEARGAAPCIVHTHGGGMVLMSAQDPMFVRWRDSLADLGMVAVGVEFRNGGGKLGNHPFPAGLNDCAAAVQWVHAHREALGVSRIVISGESGGGNLSLATALKAKREGWIDQIDGVYGMCPYISGAYADPPESLLSLYENDGYMLSCSQMASLVTVYDPAHEHATNPLAWPYHAKDADLAGLPPHVISVNELDPLRDEGLSYYRKLLGAGVSAVGRTVHGTPHAGDLSFPDVTPELYQETLRSLHGFARSL
jgi:acetyl esterase/lipase